MTQHSTAAPRAVVIATPDARTRSACTVQLVQRGDTIVSAADFKALDLSDGFRRNATIVIAEGLLPADTSAWRDVILDHGWRGKVVVLGSQHGAGDPALEGIAYLPYPFETGRLLAQL